MIYEAEYASEVMEAVPAGYIDKTICACGLTTLALENNIPTIIAVPSVPLIINKRRQYPNHRTTNIVMGVWGDTKMDDIYAYQCHAEVIKIMVTYDSINKVKHLLNTCHLIIDESQELLALVDGRPEAVDNLLEIAEKYRDTVSFISATPIPLEYLPKWISGIKRVKMMWKNTKKAVPILCERTYPYKALRDEFIQPLYKNKSLTVAGKTFSKVLIFVNAIANIVAIVKESGICKEDCAILCGDNLKNDVSISGMTRYVFGEMPLFTFVTKSGFKGIDLYDDSVMTIVVSNTNKEWRMMDMHTDLKQAISRMRTKSNPNYGSYIYIYNQSIFSKTDEELSAIIEERRKKIEVNVATYKGYKAKGEERYFMHDADFSAFTLFKNGLFKLNEMSFNAEKYKIEVTRKQYTKGFDISGQFDESKTVKAIYLPNKIKYVDVVEYFKKNHVKGIVDWDVYSTKTQWTQVIEESYKYYKKVWNDFTYAKLMVVNYGNAYALVKIDIKRAFTNSARYSRKEIKEILTAIYKEHNIQRKAKHNDLREVFTIKEVTIMGERMICIIDKN